MYRDSSPGDAGYFAPSDFGFDAIVGAGGGAEGCRGVMEWTVRAQDALATAGRRPALLYESQVSVDSWTLRHCAACAGCCGAGVGYSGRVYFCLAVGRGVVDRLPS